METKSYPVRIALLMLVGAGAGYSIVGEALFQYYCGYSHYPGEGALYRGVGTTIGVAGGLLIELLLRFTARSK
jgi:hypothetical protein